MAAKKPGGRRSARTPTKRHSESGHAALDAALRSWWAGFAFPADRSDRELLALGDAAFERLLDCAEGTVDLDIEQDVENFRDYGDWRAVGLCAFGKVDPAGVLEKVKARGWNDARIASYLGGVPDPCFLPYVTARLGNASQVDRVAAVIHLGLHRDPRATDALLRALKDRVSFVRFCALEALGRAGDPRAVEALQRFADEIAGSKRDGYLANVAREAVEKIQASSVS